MKIETVREQFPILSRQVHGKPLVYLDSGATALKPNKVIDAICDHYRDKTSNVHRGVHFLSEQATEAFERVRESSADFIGAASSEEIIFTPGTSYAINLVAQCWGRELKKDDEIVLTEMEHHANIVPWQMLCERTGAKLRYIPVTGTGELDMQAADDLIGPATKMVAFSALSNVLGTINPVKALIEKAKSVNAATLVDAAQAVAHMPIDVGELDCDFLAFSAHKLFGPTGVGILFGKRERLEQMAPFLGGGGMIHRVEKDRSSYAPPPSRYEPGTPNIAGIVGLGAAIEFVKEIGYSWIAEREADLLDYGRAKLSEVAGLKLFGNAEKRAAIFSFAMEGIHPHDLGTLVDREGVAVRVGHHCCQPLMETLGVSATTRASLALYNTRSEIDALCSALEKAKEIF